MTDVSQTQTDAARDELAFRLHAYVLKKLEGRSIIGDTALSEYRFFDEFFTNMPVDQGHREIAEARTLEKLHRATSPIDVSQTFVAMLLPVTGDHCFYYAYKCSHLLHTLFNVIQPGTISGLLPYLRQPREDLAVQLGMSPAEFEACPEFLTLLEEIAVSVERYLQARAYLD